MDRNLFRFLAGTKIQSLVASIYSFGFLLIFYQKTGSLVYSSFLTALTVIVSRVTLLISVPHFKNKHPLKLSIIMNFLIGVVSVIGGITYHLWEATIIGYFVIAIIFECLEQIDNSSQYAVIPNIVDPDYLFKANSLSAMLTNINLIAAPIGSFIFYCYSDLRGFLFIYGIICFVSCLILKGVNLNFKEAKEERIQKKGKSVVLHEWKKTLRIINQSSDLIFCIAVGVAINLIFAGLNGAVLLKMGEISHNKAFGQASIKIFLSVGSLLGVTGVYKLKVKENYEKYLRISIVGLCATLLALGFTPIEFLLYVEFLLLAVFIMFIMNSTGTFLQMAAPKNELSAIYAFRSTLYAIVIPLSHMIAGFILQYFHRSYYFIFSCVLIICVVLLKRITGLRRTKQEEDSVPRTI